MVEAKGKKAKVEERQEDEESEQINGELVLSIEKLQEIQDELEKFLSHPVLSDLVTEEDQKIFKYLKSLDVEDSKDVKSGYTFTFNFSPNPFFEDTKLTKTYTFLDDGTNDITGTNIKWKEGRDISNGVNHEKGKKRPLKEESFFNWFSDTEQKIHVEGMSDEVAEIIKEDLWPNPLKYFNNEDDEEDFDGDDDDEGGDEDGDEDDEDDEE